MKHSLIRNGIATLFCWIAATSVAFAEETANATDPHWVATWGAAPVAAGPALKAQTVRQVVRTSIGGTGVRLHFSNLFGAAASRLGRQLAGGFIR